MEIKGDASKARLIAAFIDNIIGFGVMLIAVGLTPTSWPAVRAVLVVAGYLGYYFVLEGLWGRTIGKYLQGLVVRDLDGTRAGWKAALIRTLLRIVEVNPVLFGAIPAGIVIFYSKKNQRFGDELADTIVVSDKLEWSGRLHESDAVE